MENIEDKLTEDEWTMRKLAQASDSNFSIINKDLFQNSLTNPTFDDDLLTGWLTVSGTFEASGNQATVTSATGFAKLYQNIDITPLAVNYISARIYAPSAGIYRIGILCYDTGSYLGTIANATVIYSSTGWYEIFTHIPIASIPAGTNRLRFQFESDTVGAIVEKPTLIVTDSQKFQPYKDTYVWVTTSSIEESFSSKKSTLAIESQKLTSEGEAELVDKFSQDVGITYNSLTNPTFDDDLLTGWLTVLGTFEASGNQATVTSATGFAKLYQNIDITPLAVNYISARIYAPSAGIYRIGILCYDTGSYLGTVVNANVIYSSTGWYEIFTHIPIAGIPAGTNRLRFQFESDTVGAIVEKPTLIVTDDEYIIDNVDIYLTIDSKVPVRSLFSTKSEKATSSSLLEGFDRPYAGKKAVFLGDSITFQRKWIPQLINYLGINYIDDEINPGTGGNYPTGVGGSKVVPAYTDASLFGDDGDWVNAGGKQNSSLYTRADDIVNYNPDVIFVFGGQNDEAGNIGTINDPIYTSGEVPSGDPSEPTFYSAYKGMLYKLTNANPRAKIICLTIMHNWYYDPADSITADLFRVDIKDAIINCAKEFSCTVVDLWDNAFNAYNAGGHDNSGGEAEEIFFNPDGLEADWITNGSARVHPNTAGGEVMAREIVRSV